MEKIRSFFEPGSIALVGATDRAGVVSGVILDNLLLARDRRRIYAVNPNREKIFDLKCYASLSSLPETVDLAVIATDAKIVPDIMEECGRTGTKAAIIISAGFKEAGNEGKARENSIADIVREHGIRIIGPNCLGVIKPGAGLNATFATKMSKPGCIAAYRLARHESVALFFGG